MIKLNKEEIKIVQKIKMEVGVYVYFDSYKTICIDKTSNSKSLYIYILACKLSNPNIIKILKFRSIAFNVLMCIEKGIKKNNYCPLKVPNDQYIIIAYYMKNNICDNEHITQLLNSVKNNSSCNVMFIDTDMVYSPLKNNQYFEILDKYKFIFTKTNIENKSIYKFIGDKNDELSIKILRLSEMLQTNNGDIIIKKDGTINSVIPFDKGDTIAKYIDCYEWKIPPNNIIICAYILLNLKKYNEETALYYFNISNIIRINNGFKPFEINEGVNEENLSVPYFMHYCKKYLNNLNRTLVPYNNE